MRRGSGGGRRAGWAVVLVAACLASPAGLTAEGGALSEHEFFGDVPVVLSASRLAQPASDAPNAITVIDRELIRASGVRDLPDLFRLVPGMYVTYQAYALGLQGIVAYHGLASEIANRMQVLIDGRAVYNPTLAHVSWSDLPLAIEDIERIEVIRGPSAASHGHNSFFGVINIITQHAAQARGTYAALNHGSKGIDDRIVRHGGAAGDLDYRVTLAYRSDEGFDGIADSRHLRIATVRGDYRVNPSDTIELQVGYNGGPRETQTASSLQPNELDYPREFRVRNYFEQLRWRRALDPGNEVSLQVYHNHTEIQDEFESLPIFAPPVIPTPQRFPIDDSIRTDRYDVELQQIASLSPRLRGVWGASWRRDSVDAPNWGGVPVSNGSRRLFAHAEWRAAERWLVNAGAMLERTQFTGTDVSPRFSLHYRLATGHTLRAGISRALRNPSILEERGNRKYTLGPVLIQRFLASGELHPERILSREVGYIFDVPGSTLSFDTRIFHDRISGLIGVVTVPYPPSTLSGSTWDFRNITDARQKGFESQLHWRPTRSMRLGVSQSYIVTESPLDDDDDSIPRSTPRTSYGLFAVEEFSGDTTLSATFVRQTTAQALGFSERQEPYGRLDMRLAHRFRIGASRAEAALVVQNVLDDQYTEFRHDNVFDRRAYATLSVNF